MKRSTDRILTTHGGSLNRPDDLREMIYAKEEGKPVDEAAFQARVRSAVKEVVQKQVEAGIDVISDGEMSKVSFAGYVKDRLAGFEGRPIQAVQWADLRAFPEVAQRIAGTNRGAGQMRTCTGPVTYKGQALLEQDLENFKTALRGMQCEDAFIPAATPSQAAGVNRNEYYPSEQEYLFAVADAMQVEYKAIIDAGFVLQLDSPDMALGRQTAFADRPLAEFQVRVELAVAALNRGLAGLPKEMTRLHVCWGNQPGPHHLDVPLADIIAIVLKANVGAIYIEAFNPRHEHEWTVFEKTKRPDGMALVVGMIDTKTNYIEHPEAIAQRLVRYAKLVGRENLIAGTDCGFGTTAGRMTTAPSIQWAKLQTLSEGAKLASKQLWG